MARLCLRGMVVFALLVVRALASAQGPPQRSPSLNARVAALEATVKGLTGRVARLETSHATAEATIATLRSELDEVKSNSVLALDGKLKLADPDGDGLFEAAFEGVNVQIVNGLGPAQTSDEVANPISNGVGNLILGYSEPRTLLYQDEPTPRTGSHNVVIGPMHSYTQSGGLVAGYFNDITGRFSTVTGGAFNRAIGPHSSIAGGSGNDATGMGSSIGGGSLSSASGGNSSVSGGYHNQATSPNSSVCGGAANKASGIVSSISGGDHNSAVGAYSSVSGGQYQTADGDYSWAPYP
jgi:hypothetical protein